MNAASEPADHLPQPVESEPLARAPYTAPTLERFGRLDALTLGGATSLNDDSGMNSMSPN